ncbi:MAG TPA: hypothetical protein VF013_03350, partial [Candidatus Limnocylindria bacterium]
AWRRSLSKDRRVITRRRQIHPLIRALPWILALAGVLVPLLGSGLALWPFAVGWLILLALAWAVGLSMLPTRTHRIAAALIAIPVLLILAWEGGWWLIPADIAWLAVEVAGRPGQQPGGAAV